MRINTIVSLILGAFAGVFLAMTPALAQDKKSPDYGFYQEVMTYFFKGREACMDLKSGRYCLTRDRFPLKPLMPDDGPNASFGGGMLLCAQTEGRITGCMTEVSDIHCAEGAGCFCRGEASCIKLAESGRCDDLGGGHCGDCSTSDCCCTGGPASPN